MAAAGSYKLLVEESPDTKEQRCQVTPGRGNATASATESRPPMTSLEEQVRVKGCGKSAPVLAEMLVAR